MEFQNFKVENEQTAYILGYLWADGSIFKDKNGIAYIRLRIIRADANEIKPLFDKFSFLKKWASYDRHHVCETRNHSPSTEFALYNANLGNFLIDELNYKNKSFDSPEKVLNFIPERFQKFWWRGYFDGDGYIGTKDMTITSTYEQDWSLTEDLFKNLEVNYIIRRKICKKHGHKSSTIRVSYLEGMVKFATYLYGDYTVDKIGLRRKADKLIIIKEKYEKVILTQHSKYKGVTYNIANKKWRANYLGVYLGSYKTEQEALFARTSAEKQIVKPMYIKEKKNLSILQ